MKYDVAIIGGGVVGALTARELSRYDLRVVVLEKESDVAYGASRANSGIVHSGFDPIPGTKKAALNVKGAAMMEALAADLGVTYHKNGSMVLAFSEEEMATVRKLYERGVANGVPGISLLTGAEVLALEGRVSPQVVGALRCVSSGIVCPYGLTIAAMGNAMDNGVELRYEYAVDRIEQKDGSFSIYAGEECVEAAYLVNSAGMYADRIAAMVGDDEYQIIPKKGEYMLLDRAEGDLCSHTLFQVPTAAGKGVLVSPTADGNLLVGPTSVAIDDRECRDTTVEGLDYIKQAAGKSVADIPYRQVITSFTGVRAALVGEEDFVIEPSKKNGRAIHLLGIDSPGLSSAPAIAEEVASLLRDAGLTLTPKKNFNGKRDSYHVFGHLSDEEKNEWIKRDPSYGHMICRCETITEGEIREATRRKPPARTMDAVKRRVRPGMGRCQGGCCTTYVAELIAEENHMKPTEVTKFGTGSELLTGLTRGGN